MKFEQQVAARGLCWCGYKLKEMFEVLQVCVLIRLLLRHLGVLNLGSIRSIIYFMSSALTPGNKHLSISSIRSKVQR